MKTSFKLLAIFLSVSAYGQQVDSFAFLGNSFDRQWAPGSMKVSGNADFASNAINTQMINDVVFRSSFTPEAKQKFLDGTQDRVNLYSSLNATVEVKLDSQWGVYASSQSFGSFFGNKSLSELLIFGNAPFIGQTVSSSDLRFLRYQKSGIGATYNLNQSKKLQSKASFGVTALSNYRAVSSSNISLFTAPGGEYIDVNAENLALSEKSPSSLKGIGVDLGLNFEYSLNNKNSFGLALQDLNLTHLFGHTSIELDSTFRFTGIGYDLINDTNSLQQYVDSNYVSILDNSRQTLKWTTLPSRINLSWTHALSESSSLVTSIQMVDMGKYGVTGTLGLNHDFNTKFRLYSSVGYGNFSGIIWNEAAEYRMKRLNIYARVQGLQALIASRAFTNYGVSFGISTQF